MAADLDGLVGHIHARFPSTLWPRACPVDLGNAGGTSGARLWRFDSGAGPILLRRWPATGPSAARLRQLHGWLGELRELAFIARPIPDTRGETWFEFGGCLHQLEPWLPGRSAEGEANPARVSAGFSALALVHRRLQRHEALGPSPGVAQRREELARFVAAEREELRRLIDRASPSRERALALRYLERARGAAEDALKRVAAFDFDVALQPCLRDCRAAHLLFEGPELRGIVDYGAMGVESRAADVARLIGTWLDDARELKQIAFDSYTRIMKLGERELEVIELYARAAQVLGPLRWLRWHFVDGRVFEETGAVARALARGLEMIDGAPGLEWSV